MLESMTLAVFPSVKKSLSKSDRDAIHPRRAFLFGRFMRVEGEKEMGYMFSGERQS